MTIKLTQAQKKVLQALHSGEEQPYNAGTLASIARVLVANGLVTEGGRDLSKPHKGGTLKITDAGRQAIGVPVPKAAKSKPKTARKAALPKLPDGVEKVELDNKLCGYLIPDPQYPGTYDLFYVEGREYKRLGFAHDTKRGADRVKAAYRDTLASA